MNQNKQIHQVTQEDLAKTLVLNLDDVKEVAKFERKTSKRPAVLFAIAGILAITLGTTYPNIMAAIDNMPSTVSSSIVEEVNQKEEKEEVVVGETGTCLYTSELNADGTQGTVEYNFIFKDNLLQSYTKTLVLNKVQEAGLTTINHLYGLYQPLNTYQTPGYQIFTNYTDTGIKIVMKADLTKLDRTQITPAMATNFYSNVEYRLGDTKEAIYAHLAPSNYVCK